MLVLPTSGTTAIILEQPMGSPLWVLFGYLVVALAFAVVYCAWEMLFSLLAGHGPSRSRWTMLLVAMALFAAGVLVEAFLTVRVAFNSDLETYWGFVLSPWFFVAFIPCGMVLVAFRIADVRRSAAVAHLPAVVWWCAGCAVVSAYGVAALWAGGRSAALESSSIALGLGLAVAGGGSLVVAAIVRWRHRGSVA